MRSSPYDSVSDKDPIWAAAMRAAASVARTSAASEEALFQAVLEAFRRLDLQGSLHLLDQEELLEIKVSFFTKSILQSLGRVAGLDCAGYRFDPSDVDVCHDVICSGTPRFTDDQREVISILVPSPLRPIQEPILEVLGEHALIVAPLLLEDEVHGVLNVSADWLTEEDAPMVAVLADHVSIALGQIRDREAMRRSLEREKLRSQVAEITTSGLDIEEVISCIYHLIAESIGADAGAVALLDSEKEKVHDRYIYGMPESFSPCPAPRGDEIAWQIIETREPVVMEEYSDHPQASDAWIRAGVRAFIGVPLIANDVAIGAMRLFMREGDQVFQPEHLKRAQAISRIAAVLIQNSRLLSSATRYANEANALMQSALAISSSLEYETVLTKIAEQAKQLFRADGSRIHLFDPETKRLRCVVALQPHADAIKAVELKPGQGLTGFVLQSGQSLMVNDPSAHPQALQIPGTPEEEPEILLFAPLQVRNRSMGVMTIRREGLDRPFSASDLELLEAFASQAAVAIENSHLYSHIESQAQRLEGIVAERTHELALSEARYRSLVENSLTGIYQLDRHGKITYVNQQLADMLGYSQNQMIDREIVDFVIPAQRLREKERICQRLAGECAPSEVHEMRLVSSRKVRIPVIVAVSLIDHREDVPQGISGLILDISSSKALEAALAAERDRLKAILTNIGDAVVVTDPEGVIEYVNPAWENLNDYSFDEAQGMTHRLIRSGEQDDDFYDQMWRTLQEGKVWRGELVNRRKNGSLYDAALTITPVIGEAGKIINFVGVQHDISTLKEVDRLKSKFVSDVSHEFRTPLTNIRLYLDLLGQTEFDQRAARYLRTLSRESERISCLIEDLLSLSRLESGALPFSEQQVDVNAILRDLVEDRERLAAQKGISLRLVCRANLPMIVGDMQLLSQVFTNLLTNAMNYTLGGGTIEIWTRQHQGQREGWISIEVTDTGLGIPPEELPHIFDRFYRGKASELISAPGTGLGLSICKEIVERHAGQIHIDSEGIPGKGTQVTVWLPIGE